MRRLLSRVGLPGAVLLLFLAASAVFLIAHAAQLGAL